MEEERVGRKGIWGIYVEQQLEELEEPNKLNEEQLAALETIFSVWQADLEISKTFWGIQCVMGLFLGILFKSAVWEGREVLFQVEQS